MRSRILSPDSSREFLADEHCHILESWNSAEDPAVSIARARVEPGVATRLHALERTAERYLILSGNGRVEIGDLPPTDVGAGDVVLIPPGIPQRITNTGNIDLLFYAICTPRFRQECYRDLED